MLLKSDSTSWRKTLQISHNSIEWLVVNTPFREKIQHHIRKDGSKGTPILGPYWKLQLVACTVKIKLRSELCLWIQTILTRGSELLMDQTSLWWIRTKSRKFQKFSSKKMRFELNAKDFACRSKAEAKPQRRGTKKSSYCEENVDWCWTRWIFTLRLWHIEETDSSSSRNISYLETIMERFISGEWKIIFRNISHTVLNGLTISGRGAWQEEKETRKDTSIVLIFRNNLVLPSSSRSFWTQSQWSSFAGLFLRATFFQYIHLFGCAINLHSIINSGLTPGPWRMIAFDRVW